jgi:cytochrome c biogenesis protein
MRTGAAPAVPAALASVPGSFLPQRTLNPVEVQAYFVEHPTLGAAARPAVAVRRLRLPWFAAVYLLLFVSLIGCLSSRLRLHARALRTPPPEVPRVLSRLPVHERWTSAQDATAVLDDARRSLRRSRWRVVTRELPGGGQGLSAEKGYLRETGNLLFHVSLVLLLVGIALGGLFGFKGTVLVKEGDGFANTVLSYDDINPGRQFDAERLVPFSFALDDFQGTYDDDGKALSFLAKLRYADDLGEPTTPYDIRVNHPLTSAGQGLPARPRLRAEGRRHRRRGQPARADGGLPAAGRDVPVDLRHQGAGRRRRAAGLRGRLHADDRAGPETGRVTSVYPAPENPALTVLGYRGDLGLDSGVPQSVYQLEDRSQLRPIGDGTTPVKLAEGETWELPGGGSLTFVETAEWATFQVTQDPGKLVALVAGTGMVVGLCLSLFVRRRRLWLRTVPAGAPSAGPSGGDDGDGRTVIEVAGLARTGPEAFEAEFADLVERLRPTPARAAQEDPA